MTSDSELTRQQIWAAALYLYALLWTALLLVPTAAQILAGGLAVLVGCLGVRGNDFLIPTRAGLEQMAPAGHAVGYLLLCWFAAQASTAKSRPLRLAWVVFAVVVHAILSEAAQYPIPGRQCDVADLAANLGGIGIYLLVLGHC